MVLLFLLLVLPQRGAFYEHYDRGLDALAEEDYAVAVEHLQKAVEARPKSDSNARTYSMRTINYHPYRYLAEANLYLSRPDAARRYLRLYDENREAEMISPAARNKMEVLRALTMVGSQAAAKPDAGAPPETGPDQPAKDPLVDLLPVLDALLKGRHELAQRRIKQLLRDSPDDQGVLLLSRLGEQMKSDAQALEQVQEQVALRIQENMDAGRNAYNRDLYQDAAQYFNNVLALAPDNSEAQAMLTESMERLRERWRSEGRNDDEVETLRRRLSAATREFEDQNSSLMKELREKRRSLEDMRNRLQNQAQNRPSDTPTADFRYTPFSESNGNFANIQLRVRHQKGVQKVALFRAEDAQQLGEWPAEGSQNFLTPVLIRQPFSGGNGGVYAEILDLNDKLHRINYRYTYPTRPLPFYKKRSVQKAIMVGFGICVALLLFYNHRRRRVAFRERFNPYIAGAPVLDEKMFYGRTMTLKQILNALHNNSLMIYGERRIGKTSFLHRLYNDLRTLDDPQYEFIPVLIDLQGVAEIDFFHTLEQEIALALESRGITLEEEAPPQLGSRVFISRLRKYIRMLKESSTKKPKLVLLLDEVDVMNGYAEHTNQQLRSVFMKGFAEHIVAVMAGIHINTRWKSEGSPWYNFFEQIALKPFPKSQAYELIRKPVQGIYSYTDDALARILEVTNGKPYLIQKMCLNLVSHILAENKRKVSLDDVNYVYKNMQKEFDGA